MRRDVREAIVKVGDGRGFLVASVRWAEPLVITAAHCLPRFPPPHTFSYTAERTYLKLLGPLSDSTRTVAAECLFVDPVSDVAVLAAPDSQSLSDEYERYDALTADRRALRITTPHYPADVSLLTLHGKWERCNVLAPPVPLMRHLSIVGKSAAYAPGTSGSPILTHDWDAIGLVSGGDQGNPVLALCLPMWLLTEMEGK
jgi:hypothetical protein